MPAAAAENSQNRCSMGNAVGRTKPEFRDNQERQQHSRTKHQQSNGGHNAGGCIPGRQNGTVPGQTKNTSQHQITPVAKAGDRTNQQRNQKTAAAPFEHGEGNQNPEKTAQNRTGPEHYIITRRNGDRIRPGKRMNDKSAHDAAGAPGAESVHDFMEKLGDIRRRKQRRKQKESGLESSISCLLFLHRKFPFFSKSKWRTPADNKSGYLVQKLFPAAQHLPKTDCAYFRRSADISPCLFLGRHLIKHPFLCQQSLLSTFCPAISLFFSNFEIFRVWNFVLWISSACWLLESGSWNLAAFLHSYFFIFLIRVHPCKFRG